MRNRIKRVEVLFEFLRVLVAMVIAYALVLVCIGIWLVNKAPKKEKVC